MKKIILVAVLVVLITVSSVFNSCESKTYDEISGIENPTYSTNVKAVIVNNCFPCHSESGAQLPTMESYDQTRDAAENGDMICRIDDQSCGDVMPQSGRMPQSTIDLIKLWRDQGFVN